MTEIKLGQRYGKLSNAMATMGFHSYIGIVVVVDMTKRAVGLKIEQTSDCTLLWLLKTDVDKCLELIDE